MKDLAKRSKASMMALGRERAETARLQGEVAKLKREVAAGKGGGATPGPPGSSQRPPGSAPGGMAPHPPGSAAARLDAASALAREARAAPEAHQRELKELRDNFAYSQARLHEAKLNAQSHKAEMQRYMRALSIPFPCAASWRLNRQQ